MTVSKGKDWGRRIARPDGLVEVGSDAEAGALIDRLRGRGHSLPVLGLRRGDLRRTLGAGTPDGAFGPEVSAFTVDLGVVEVAGVERCFVSHAVARRSWWRGEVVAVMNAQFVGRWDVAPRGHPNDGRLDVVRTRDLGLADRWKAWRRLPAGAHVPHPAIEVRSVASAEVELARPLALRIDGVEIGPVERFRIRVEPDALVVCV